jgi:hypothetical protein
VHPLGHVVSTDQLALLHDSKSSLVPTMLHPFDAAYACALVWQ